MALTFDVPKKPFFLFIFVICFFVFQIIIDGCVFGKDLGDQRTNRFYISSSQNEDVRGSCNVEIVALDYFTKDRFKEGKKFNEV